ncbi:HlyU family transcriptional regulator [Geminicoccaceae bacterium 1502E]|nr:HlyU family transcriptional regulator [Geminicoccaceae bacterium 1502E]
MAMGLGDMLKKLLGGGGGGGEPPAPDRSAAVEYKGYRIIPHPRPHGGQFLTSGIIEKDFPEGMRSHEFIRADTHASADDAKSFAIIKGRQIIDQEGDRVFRTPPPRADG